MVPWQSVARAQTPDGEHELGLFRRGAEFVIRVDGRDLMNSRVHFSEEAMAELACAELQATTAPHVLVGGLGMGFTLAACLRSLPADATIEVLELVQEVIEWNQGPLAHLAGSPLADPRVQAHARDVRERISSSHDEFDAILLDVDNGPSAMSQSQNQSLYSSAGLKRVVRALKPGGVFSVWSAGADTRFTNRLNSCGMSANPHWVRARPGNKGAAHCVWIARKPPAGGAVS